MRTVKPAFYSLISILFLADHVAISVKLSRQNDTGSRKVCAKCRMTSINLWANSTDTQCKAKRLPINSHEHQFPANSMPVPSAPTSNRQSSFLLNFPIAVISPDRWHRQACPIETQPAQRRGSGRCRGDVR